VVDNGDLVNICQSIYNIPTQAYSSLFSPSVLVIFGFMFRIFASLSSHSVFMICHFSILFVHHVDIKFQMSYQQLLAYCKTCNICMPFISQISRAKQNREIKGHEYQLQAKK